MKSSISTKDADLPDSLVQPFQEQGHDAVHVREIGLGAASDAAIVETARERQRIIVTRDQDFGNPLLHNPEEHCGIVILRLPNTYRIDRLKQRVATFLDTVTSDEIRDNITVVEAARYRVRRP